MKKFKQVAINSARLAGKISLKYFNNLKRIKVTKKGKHDIVTKADLEANKVIIHTIKKSFPDHDILSEETGWEDNPGDYKWVIDPIDGTTNFTVHIPLFCTAISLIYKEKILLSVIYAPFSDELFYAEQGQGAYLNNKKIKVSTTKKLDEAYIFIGRGHGQPVYRNFIKMQRKLREDVVNIRLIGSASMSLAYVAAGRTDSYLRVPPNVSLWDSAAGVLMVTEAGGKVTDFKGRHWQFNGQGLVATNKVLHWELIKRLNL